LLREAGIDASMRTWVDDTSSARARLTPEQQAHFMRIRLCLPEDREPDVAAFLERAGEPPARETATIWWDV
jgi:hypothetical protein